MLTHCFYGLIFFLISFAIKAQGYHPHHLFIKMKKDIPLGKSLHIEEVTPLIPDLYLVKTNNLSELEEEVIGWEIEYIQRDQIHDHGPLPELISDKNIKNQKELSSVSFNDEFIHRLWAFDGPWGMNVSRAYSNLPPRKAQEVIVAVVDTGVDYNHEDLKNIMWRNPGEIPGDGIDNDGNGYVDDVYGINTVVRTRFSRKATTDPMGSHWHGTHVAGTIAAQVNNGIGIAGIAHNARIMAIRSVPDSSHETDSNIIESFLYAAKNGARVINCSFGKPKTEGLAVRDVINSIGKQYGVLVVAASGNNSMGPLRWHDIDSNPQYPASFDSPNLITVAATNNKGNLASFSNIGKRSVHLTAPGNNIFSTVKNNKYSSSSGTSMATPYVSGAAAMLLGYFPEFTPEEIKEILMGSVRKSQQLEGKIKSPGILDLAAALEAATNGREAR